MPLCASVDKRQDVEVAESTRHWRVTQVRFKRNVFTLFAGSNPALSNAEELAERSKKIK